MLHGREQFAGTPGVAECVERQDQFAGLGPGDPWAMVDAADPEPVDDEVRPALADPFVRVGAAHRSPEDRVVPVHRVLGLGRERFGVPTQSVAEADQRDLPFGLRLTYQVGDPQTAPQTLVDARTAREQSFVEHAAVASRPGDLAARQLHVDHEVERCAHRRPHVLDEPAIARHEMVVPYAHRDVGREIAVGVMVLDDVAAELDGPRPVGALRPPRPLEGGVRLLAQTAGGQRHRGFDVIPRVDVTSGEPRDGSRGLLHPRDGPARRQTLFRRQHTRYRRHRHARGFTAPHRRFPASRGRRRHSSR